eukprot:scaffold8457_cov112-Isochrysis_galbana.AAC.10
MPDGDVGCAGWCWCWCAESERCSAVSLNGRQFYLGLSRVLRARLGACVRREVVWGVGLQDPAKQGGRWGDGVLRLTHPFPLAA